jgi:hypothetical protein
MKRFVKSMLTDCHSGEISSKRVITFTGFITVLIMMILTCFSRAVAPAPGLLNVVEVIVIAAMTGSTAEKFSKHKATNKPTAKDEEPII